jgi:protein gp37
MARSSIEWTEVTWNPVTGCTKISAGCKNCYAERLAIRLQHMGVAQYKKGFKLALAPHALELPYSWKKQKMVFVNSMSDLFHKDIPLEYIQKVFKVMNETKHIYQILTKRSERLKEIASELNWTDNIWMGVSVEEEKVSYRIPDLIETPAKVKFLSIEPLIGAVQNLYLDGIDWVIVGGESGPGARGLKKEWVEYIKDECLHHEVPFFLKQWGKKQFNPDPNDPTIDNEHENHAKGGCLLDSELYREMPAF